MPRRPNGKLRTLRLTEEAQRKVDTLSRYTLSGKPPRVESQMLKRARRGR